jgi:subtilisin family serine protease
MKRFLIAFAAIALCALTLPYRFVAHSQNNAPAPSANQFTTKFRKSSRPIAGQYIVAFHDDFDRSRIASKARSLASAHGGRIMFTYEDAIKGFAVEMPEQAAIALSHNPLVESVSENGYSTVTGTQTTPQGPTTFWGLDRIDQSDLPLNNTYNYNRVGSGVHAYVLDTGIWVTHQEFGTHALTVDSVDGGYDSFGGDGIDRNNHGTFVAGIIGGKTYGVAKNVQLHSVKVCTDNTPSQCPDSNVIAGLNWVISHHTKPAVVNMSFAGSASTNLDNAVRNTIAAGVTVVVGAGNSSSNVSNFSPARVSEAITVGATTRTDTMAFYSNFGFGLDVFAPGGEAPDHYIPVPASGWFYGGANNVSDGFTGTSAAAPHVTGVVALYLEQYSLYSPNDPATSPANVSNVITSNATPNRISGVTSSPNLLLYSLFMTAPASNPIFDTPFFVRQQYYDFQRRVPDATGFNNWVNEISSCGSDWPCINSKRIHVVRGTIESAEFRQGKPALSNPTSTDEYNREYVRQLYLCLLQREPDSGGFATYVSELNGTGNYDHAVHGFINSSEYLSRFGQP